MSATWKSVFRPDLFVDRVAIVTGGGTGIGRAISTELLSLGCNVVIASRNEDKLKAAVTQMSARHDCRGVAAYTKCNIRDEEDVRQLMQFTKERFGQIDYLVNNSGGQFPQLSKDMSTKGWKSVLDLNLTGTFVCCREAFNAYFEEHGGAIVNIVANYFNGFPGMSHTGAARAGVANMTKSLAYEWASSSVRVNAVAPGIIYNDSAHAHYEQFRAPGTDNFLYQGLPTVPLNRLGTQEEVAAAVCFLLSPAASYITGDVIKVDGAQNICGPITVPGFTVPMEISSFKGTRSFPPNANVYHPNDQAEMQKELDIDGKSKL